MYTQETEPHGLVARFSEHIRALPLAGGSIGFVALLLNRAASGVAPVVEAGSSQSRVDVLVIAIAATLALTGFQWLALKPAERAAVRTLPASHSDVGPLSHMPDTPSPAFSAIEHQSRYQSSSSKGHTCGRC